LNILNLNKDDEDIETNDGEIKEYFLISANWVTLALPFIEEFINENTKISEDDFFNVSKIFNKSIALYDLNKFKNIKPTCFNYPNKINNHDIIDQKDFWFDFHEDYSHTNIYLKKDARENQNFFYLSRKNWELIDSIFGSVNKIKRFSRKDNPSQIDVNLIRVKN
jgi:hypothetical protein